MKFLRVFICVSLALNLALRAEEEDKIALRLYETLPRFGISSEFYSDHDYVPLVYLHQYQVEKEEAVLTRSEKISAALLVTAADHATIEKYGLSYGVNMKSPLMVLLTKNFPSVKKIKPTHEVNRGHLPLRDLGAFFRVWLEEELAEKSPNTKPPE